MKYHDGKIVEKIQQENKRTCNGFLILVDIKNSTDRKKTYPVKWVLHNEAVYKAFTKFAEHVKKEIPIFKDFVMPVKFIGDAGMAFFRYSETKSDEENKKVKSETANKLLDLLLDFRNQIHEENDLLGLRLKTVVTYLTDVFVYDDDDGVRDILGRGVDFCFRLEKFAEPTHIVMNEMFRNSIDPDKVGKYKTEYDLLNCKKKIKGWTKNPDGEIFFIMTSKSMLDSHLILSTSNNSDHVTNELINFFKDEVDKEAKKSEKQKSDSESEAERWKFDDENTIGEDGVVVSENETKSVKPTIGEEE